MYSRRRLPRRAAHQPARAPQASAAGPSMAAAGAPAEAREVCCLCHCRFTAADRALWHLAHLQRAV
eukprot:8010647-Pyramimonas_sp.AAC.1